MAQQDVTFMYSAFGPSQFPAPSLPEVAFAGRSNVGKSSLLNALMGQRQLARVSSTPGRTRCINFFLVRKRFLFADLPGYGFARVPTSVQVSWQRLVNGYLEERPSLAGVMLLVDSRHPPHESDLQLAGWLNERELPFLLVATKFDKISPSRREAQLMELAQGYGVDPGDILPVSSTTGEGIADLWAQIEAVVGASERWLKAQEMWGIPSLKGPKAEAPARARAAASPEAPAEEARQGAREPRLTPLHPEFYKQKYKQRAAARKKAGPKRR